MSRFDQHSAYSFLTFFIIHFLWTGSFFMSQYLVLLSVIFGMFPDLDGFYFIIKHRGDGIRAVDKIDENFQHHYFSPVHNPLNYFPFVIVFIFALIFNFYPLYFLTPVVGIYCHFFIDTFASGDGIMWGKNPFKKEHYGRFFNFFSKKTDGYHGYYWDARYRKTYLCKIGNICVLASAIILQIMQIYSTIFVHYLYSDNLLYSIAIVYLIMILLLGTKAHPEEWLDEPPKGRYHDHRIDPKYINGLSERNRKKHLEKYPFLLK